MVGLFKRPAGDDTLDARIAVLSRRAQPLVNAPEPAPVAPPDVVPQTSRPLVEAGRVRAPEIAIAAAPAIAASAASRLLAATTLPQDLTEEDRFLLAREELFAKLTAELSPERISILSRGELAKVVDAAVQAHFVRSGVEADPIARRDLITALIKGLLDPAKNMAAGDEGGARRATVRPSSRQRRTSSLWSSNIWTSRLPPKCRAPFSRLS
jgi:hypothetical protein